MAKKLFGLNLNLNHNNIIETAMAVGLVGLIGLVGFKIAQHGFGAFSYSGMNRQQVLQVARAVDSRLPILSRACGRPNPLDNRDYFCRGIYLGSSGKMLYYRMEDNPSKNHASYELYDIPTELWTTNPVLSLTPAGSIVDIGTDVTTNMSANPNITTPPSGRGIPYGLSRTYSQGVGALHQY